MSYVNLIALNIESMNVQLKWSEEDRKFEGTGETGYKIQLDSSNESGPSPMTVLLHAVAACSAIDMLNILEKMRQKVDSLEVEIKGNRATGDYPRVWEEIHLHFTLSGDLKAENVQKALSLSMDKYCSVSANLKAATKITGDFELRTSV